MKYEHANILYDTMDLDRRERVMRVFEQTFYSPAFADFQESFAQAVDNEANEIEREMLLVQPTEGTS